MQLFNAMGTALPVQNQASFDLYGALGVLIAHYFGMIEAVEGWTAGQGMPAGDARVYLSGLYHRLGTVLRDSPHSLSELRLGHSTAGGLNEPVHLQSAAEWGTAPPDRGLGCFASADQGCVLKSVTAVAQTRRLMMLGTF